MPRGSGNKNGGLIGKTNRTSFGKNSVTTVKANACSAVTTQSGTRLINTLVVAGGGGGGGYFGGGRLLLAGVINPAARAGVVMLPSSRTRPANKRVNPFLKPMVVLLVIDHRNSCRAWDMNC